MLFNFLSETDFICEILWSKKAKFSGKLIYKPGKEFTLTIYSDKILQDNKVFKEQLFLNSFDNDNKKYYITLRNCKVVLETMCNGYYSYIVYFDYALISRWKFFDFTKNKIKNINIYFSNWNEFFVNQSYKEMIELKSIYNKIKLKNNLSILYKSEYESFYITQYDNLFNILFDSEKLNNAEKETLSKSIDETIKPYKNKIKIRNKESHIWFISITLNNTEHNPNEFIWLFHVLISLLTHDFSTSIENVNIVSEIDNKEFYFDYLDYRHFTTLKSQYKNNIDAFNYQSFTEKEWKKILNNLFKHSKTLYRFFIALIENNMNHQVEEFMLARYIVCIETISVNLNKQLKSNKTDNWGKYDRPIIHFISDLDIEMQNKILNIFRRALKPFSDKKNKTKRKWQAIGVKISNLRAKLLHFNNGTTDKSFINMFDYFKMYKILELIVIDYIFKQLEFSQDKRLKYKQFYLKRILNYKIQ